MINLFDAILDSALSDEKQFYQHASNYAKNSDTLLSSYMSHKSKKKKKKTSNFIKVSLTNVSYKATLQIGNAYNKKTKGS